MNKNMLNFGFDDETVKGVKPNEPNIAVKIMNEKIDILKDKKNNNNYINLSKKNKPLRVNIISSFQTEQMLNELESLNYKINRSQIYREAVQKIYENLINK